MCSSVLQRVAVCCSVSHIRHIRMSHVKYMYESHIHTHTHTRHMSHVTYMSESRHKCHVTYMSESRHMCHVTYMYESRNMSHITYMYESPHTHVRQPAESPLGATHPQSRLELLGAQKDQEYLYYPSLSAFPTVTAQKNSLKSQPYNVLLVPLLLMGTAALFFLFCDGYCSNV